MGASVLVPPSKSKIWTHMLAVLTHMLAPKTAHRPRKRDPICSHRSKAKLCVKIHVRQRYGSAHREWFTVDMMALCALPGMRCGEVMRQQRRINEANDRGLRRRAARTTGGGHGAPPRCAA